MPPVPRADASLDSLDDATRSLVRLSAVVSAGSEDAVRALLAEARSVTPPAWIEELLLQTYLFAGFPRALNAMREWRRIAGPHNHQPESGASPAEVREVGEATCARVYGDMYERLRVNIRALHPLLDNWMIEEGYGKVLSRPGLDLPRRELCIVAACAASGQDRQLQSHLHGAVNAGVSAGAVDATLDALRGVVGIAHLERAQRMWHRISHDIH